MSLLYNLLEIVNTFATTAGYVAISYVIFALITTGPVRKGPDGLYPSEAISLSLWASQEVMSQLDDLRTLSGKTDDEIIGEALARYKLHLQEVVRSRQSVFDMRKRSSSRWN